VLFATNLGMKVEGYSGDHPLHMYLDDDMPNYEMFSVAPAYAFSAVLARKVREVDAGLHVIGSNYHNPCRITSELDPNTANYECFTGVYLLARKLV
jgi:hypothetical protein